MKKIKTSIVNFVIVFVLISSSVLVSNVQLVIGDYSINGNDDDLDISDEYDTLSSDYNLQVYTGEVSERIGYFDMYNLPESYIGESFLMDNDGKYLSDDVASIFGEEFVYQANSYQFNPIGSSIISSDLSNFDFISTNVKSDLGTYEPNIENYDEVAYGEVSYNEDGLKLGSIGFSQIVFEPITKGQSPILVWKNDSFWHPMLTLKKRIESVEYEDWIEITPSIESMNYYPYNATKFSIGINISKLSPGTHVGKINVYLSEFIFNQTKLGGIKDECINYFNNIDVSILDTINDLNPNPGLDKKVLPEYKDISVSEEDFNEDMALRYIYGTGKNINDFGEYSQDLDVSCWAVVKNCIWADPSKGPSLICEFLTGGLHSGHVTSDPAVYNRWHYMEPDFLKIYNAGVNNSSFEYTIILKNVYKGSSYNRGWVTATPSDGGLVTNDEHDWVMLDLHPHISDHPMFAAAIYTICGSNNTGCFNFSIFGRCDIDNSPKEPECPRLTHSFMPSFKNVAIKDNLLICTVPQGQTFCPLHVAIGNTAPSSMGSWGDLRYRFHAHVVDVTGWSSKEIFDCNFPQSGDIVGEADGFSWGDEPGSTMGGLGSGLMGVLEAGCKSKLLTFVVDTRDIEPGNYMIYITKFEGGKYYEAHTVGGKPVAGIITPDILRVFFTVELSDSQPNYINNTGGLNPNNYSFDSLSTVITRSINGKKDLKLNVAEFKIEPMKISNVITGGIGDYYSIYFNSNLFKEYVSQKYKYSDGSDGWPSSLSDEYKTMLILPKSRSLWPMGVDNLEEYFGLLDLTAYPTHFVNDQHVLEDENPFNPFSDYFNPFSDSFMDCNIFINEKWSYLDLPGDSIKTQVLDPTDGLWTDPRDGMDGQDAHRRNPDLGEWKDRLDDVPVGTNLTFRVLVDDLKTIMPGRWGISSSSYSYWPFQIKNILPDGLEYIPNSSFIRTGQWCEKENPITPVIGPGSATNDTGNPRPPGSDCGLEDYEHFKAHFYTWSEKSPINAKVENNVLYWNFPSLFTVYSFMTFPYHPVYTQNIKLYGISRLEITFNATVTCNTDLSSRGSMNYVNNINWKSADFVFNNGLSVSGINPPHDFLGVTHGLVYDHPEVPWWTYSRDSFFNYFLFGRDKKTDDDLKTMNLRDEDEPVFITTELVNSLPSIELLSPFDGEENVFVKNARLFLRVTDPDNDMVSVSFYWTDEPRFKVDLYGKFASSYAYNLIYDSSVNSTYEYWVHGNRIKTVYNVPSGSIISIDPRPIEYLPIPEIYFNGVRACGFPDPVIKHLSYDTNYEWYAVVKDLKHTVKSPISSFKTKSPPETNFTYNPEETHIYEQVNFTVTNDIDPENIFNSYFWSVIDKVELEARQGYMDMIGDFLSNTKTSNSVGSINDLEGYQLIYLTNMMENCTPYHAFGWAAIEPDNVKKNYPIRPMQLEIGDEVFTDDAKWVTIENIEYHKCADLNYNYILKNVSGVNNFFAGGVLVHDSDLWIYNYNGSEEFSGPVNGFLPTTKITMADGSNKPVKEIFEGDYVLSYDIEEKTFKESVVKEFVACMNEDGYYIINNGLLRIPGDHLLYIKKSLPRGYGYSFNFTFPQYRPYIVSLRAVGRDWEPILPVPSTLGGPGYRKSEVTKIINVDDVGVEDIKSFQDVSKDVNAIEDTEGSDDVANNNFDDGGSDSENNGDAVDVDHGVDEGSEGSDVSEDDVEGPDDGSTGEDQGDNSGDESDDGENPMDDYQPGFFELLLSLIKGEICLSEFIQSLFNLIRSLSV